MVLAAAIFGFAGVAQIPRVTSDDAACQTIYFCFCSDVFFSHHLLSVQLSFPPLLHTKGNGALVHPCFALIVRLGVICQLIQTSAGVAASFTHSLLKKCHGFAWYCPL